MQIFVKTLPGKIFILEVKSSDSIDSLKAKIRDVSDIPVKMQRLIFHGRQLLGDETLADYDVQDRDTLDLLLCLCGC